MGNFSLAHWAIVLVVVLVLFGRGKISETMGDFGKGIRSFKSGLAEDDKPVRTPVPQPEALVHHAPAPVSAPAAVQPAPVSVAPVQVAAVEPSAVSAPAQPTPVEPSVSEPASRGMERE